MKVSRFVLIVVGYLSVLVIGVNAQDHCSGERIFSADVCAGDVISTDERHLTELVNSYRQTNGLPVVAPSLALSRLANRRVLDLEQNIKALTHSWSNCRYDIKDEKTWPCLIDSPTRLKTGYSGQGYEALYRTTGNMANASAALEAWKKSPLHKSIILNQGMFEALPWDAMGVAVHGQYASIWFGFRGSKSVASVIRTSGLGVSFDSAVKDFGPHVSIRKVEETKAGTWWQVSFLDGKASIDLKGSGSEIVSVEMKLSLEADINGIIPPQRRAPLTRLLTNLFPEWMDLDTWLSAAMRRVEQNPTAWQTKTVRGAIIEAGSDGGNGLRITVGLGAKPKSLEML